MIVWRLRLFVQQCLAGLAVNGTVAFGQQGGAICVGAAITAVAAVGMAPVIGAVVAGNDCYCGAVELRVGQLGRR